MHSFDAILLMKNEIFVLTVCNLFEVYGAQVKNFTIRQIKNSLEIIKNNVVKKIILGVDTIIQLHHRTTNEE